MVREKQKIYRPAYAKSNIVGACICILSPLPLLFGAFSEDSFFMVIMLAVTMLLAGIGTAFFVIAGVRIASMRKLLKEGEFAVSLKNKSRLEDTISTIYWLCMVAIYLGWSLWTGAWKITWIVWPIAGVLFGVVMAILNLFTDREK